MVAELTNEPVRVVDVTSAAGFKPVDSTLVLDASGVHPVESAAPITPSDGGANGFVAKNSIGGTAYLCRLMNARQNYDTVYGQ